MKKMMTILKKRSEIPKVIKNEFGSKIIITKKVIEESSENTEGDKLQFDNGSDDMKILKKNLKNLI